MFAATTEQKQSYRQISVNNINHKGFSAPTSRCHSMTESALSSRYTGNHYLQSIAEDKQATSSDTSENTQSINSEVRSHCTSCNGCGNNEDGDADIQPAEDGGSPTAPVPIPSPPLVPPPPPVPTPTPPTPTQTVTDITVANQPDAITYPEPSNLGAAGRKHFVTVAGSGSEVIVEATLTPGGIPAPGTITWVGATPDPGNPARATVSRARAGKREVTASAGGTSASLTVWAVFARIRSAGTTNIIRSNAGLLSVGTSVNFAATISPASIITDADRPALDGANTVPPPGGNNSCGNALAGGVDHRWDMSRQIRLRNIDPAGHIATLGQCVDTVGIAYPNNRAEGNDDAGTADENNDPYANGGQITSTDTPNRLFAHALGANGDTIEQRLHFREFARLEYHRTWWNIGQFFPWRLHIRVRKDAGQWVDNGTDSALDNAGF